MKTINIYEYEELSDEAKKKAVQEVAEAVQSDPLSMEFCYQDLRKSLHAIAAHFGITVVNYEFGVGCRCPTLELNHPDQEVLRMSGQPAKEWFLYRLAKKGYDLEDPVFPGICGFTGCCYDEDLIERVWEALEDGETICQAFGAMIIPLQRVCEDEYKHETSEERARERLEDGCEDSYWFYEDGTMSSQFTANKAT